MLKVSGLRRRSGARCAAWAACALAATPSHAADSVASPAFGIAQMVLGLALVLGLIVLASWLLRRFGAGQTASGSLIRVITAASVGPRERVVLVEVQDTWLVLGVAPGRVSTLHQLPRQQVEPQGLQGPQGFARWFAEARRRQQPGQGASE
jgi:flagellar protein FliO/FliZ